MPSWFRFRTPSPTTIRVSNNSPPKTAAYPIRDLPVMPVFRLFTNPELWTLYNFECHARLCDSCLDPYTVHKTRRRLCSEGHILAQDVTRLFYSTNHGKEIHDVARDHSGRTFEIELPRDYHEVRSLLKAVERGHHCANPEPSIQLDMDHPHYLHQRPKVDSPPRRASYQNTLTATGINNKTGSPHGSAKSQSPPDATSVKQERRKTMASDLPKVVLDYGHKAPPSTWRNSVAYETPSWHQAAWDITSRDATKDYPSNEQTPATSRHVHWSSTTKTDEAVPSRRPSATRRVTPPTQSSKQDDLPTASGRRPDLSHHKGDTEPRQRPVSMYASTPTIPAKEALKQRQANTSRPRRTSLSESKDYRRASWFAGQPYHAEPRTPKKEDGKAEKEKRRRMRASVMY